jgi:thiamine-phosphate pyrophosphorylase
MELKTQLEKACLYLVIGSDSAKQRPLIQTVEMALKGGVDILQLRDYSLKDSDLLKMAQQFKALTEKFNALFIVNNRPDIAALSDADGVHLGQEDMSVADARKILGEGKIIGVSTHAPYQACLALAHGADYIGVGPVYATPTKAGRPAVTAEYVREVAAMKPPIPFFAIGGIDLSNIQEVLDAGARRIAVVRAIANAADPQRMAMELKKQLEVRSAESQV